MFELTPEQKQRIQDRIKDRIKEFINERDQYVWVDTKTKIVDADEDILICEFKPEWYSGHTKEGDKKFYYSFAFDFNYSEWEQHMNEQSKSRLDRDAEARAQGFAYVEECDMPMITPVPYTKKNSLGGWYTCYIEDITVKYWKPINTSVFTELKILA